MNVSGSCENWGLVVWALISFFQFFPSIIKASLTCILEFPPWNHLLRTLGGNRWSFMWCFNRYSIHLTCNGKMEEYCMEKLLLPTTQSPGLSAYWGQSSNSSAFVSLPAPSLVAQPIFIYHGATWCNTQKPAVQKSPPQNLPVFSLWNQGQEHCVT